MSFYVISKESFLMRYDNLRKKNKGQYAWFVQDGFINYILDYQGAKYIFRHLTVEDEPVLKMKRDLAHNILGVVEYEDLFPREIPVEASIVDSELLGLIDEEVGG